MFLMHYVDGILCFLVRMRLIDYVGESISRMKRPQQKSDVTWGDIYHSLRCHGEVATNWGGDSFSPKSATSKTLCWARNGRGVISLYRSICNGLRWSLARSAVVIMILECLSGPLVKTHPK